MPISTEASAKGTAELLEHMEANSHQLTQVLQVLDELNEVIEMQSEQIHHLEEKQKDLERIIQRRSDCLEVAAVRCIPWAQLSFEVALAEHCNLNCRSCDHFSPLAEPQFAELAETCRDFARLAELFEDRIGEIHLLGGEPLLHPQLNEFIENTRKIFPNAIIDITTNGVGLLEKPDDFWQSCKQNRIVIRPTKYPIALDYEAIEKKSGAVRRGVPLFWKQRNGGEDL